MPSSMIEKHNRGKVLIDRSGRARWDEKFVAPKPRVKGVFDCFLVLQSGAAEAYCSEFARVRRLD